MAITDSDEEFRDNGTTVPKVMFLHEHMHTVKCLTTWYLSFGTDVSDVMIMAFTQLEQTFKVNPVSPAVEYLFFTPFLEDVSLGRFQRSHQSESLIRY